LGIGGAGDEVGFCGAEEGVVEVVLDDFGISGGVVAICEETEVIAADAGGGVFVGVREGVAEFADFASFALFFEDE
jgi:hypothetical protein